jgi:hypothetical protein
MPDDRLFWAYANLIFEGFVVFILPLAFAVRELILLRREKATEASTERRDG